MNKQQFYLNPEKGHDCIKLPKKDPKYLLKDNFLSEFYTEEDKERVLSNLGILLRLEGLKALIDQKIVEAGGVPFDEIPTEDSTNILTSGSIYNALLNYYDRDYIDNVIQNLFDRIKVDNRLDKESQNAIQNGVVATALEILYNEIQQSSSAIERNIERELQSITEQLQSKVDSDEFTRQLQNKVDNEELSQYQEKLTPGENIKTINGESILGSGNIEVKGTGGGGDSTKHIYLTQEEYDNLEEYEDALYFILENWGFGGRFPITLS